MRPNYTAAGYPGGFGFYYAQDQVTICRTVPGGNGGGGYWDVEEECACPDQTPDCAPEVKRFKGDTASLTSPVTPAATTREARRAYFSAMTYVRGRCTNCR